jgi:hypothetical protein
VFSLITASLFPGAVLLPVVLTAILFPDALQPVVLTVLPGAVILRVVLTAGLLLVGVVLPVDTAGVLPGMVPLPVHLTLLPPVAFLLLIIGHCCFS